MYTAEELNNRRIKLIKIVNGGIIESIRERYTGISYALGESIPGYDPILKIMTTHNTPFTSNQLCALLAASNHKSIDDIMMTGKINPELLEKEKVFSGMEIFDVGCGLYPTFARCARRFGAEVYTADVHEHLDADKRFFSEEDYHKEYACHFSMIVTENSDLRELQNHLDFITSAHVYGVDLEQVAMRLLKKGGVYFNSGPASKFFIKEE